MQQTGGDCSFSCFQRRRPLFRSLLIWNSSCLHPRPHRHRKWRWLHLAATWLWFHMTTENEEGSLWRRCSAWRQCTCVHGGEARGRGGRRALHCDVISLALFFKVMLHPAATLRSSSSYWVRIPPCDREEYVCKRCYSFKSATVVWVVDKNTEGVFNHNAVVE